MDTVAVIGMGNMGGAMARRLSGLGVAVAARDLLPERMQGHARACASAAEAAGSAALAIVAVVDAAQTREVLFGGGGVAAAPSRPQAVLLCPTIAPADVEDCAARLAALGIAALDAPMSGGPARAADGTMSLMVAGADAAYERCAPLLAMLSNRVFRVGSRVGDAARTKLVNNLLAAINLAGAAEALALAARVGLDPARTLDVIEQSSGQSWIGSDRLRRALAGDTVPRAHTTLLRKDSALALEMARGCGLEPPVGGAAAAWFGRACALGCAELDDASLYELMLRLPGGPPASR